MKKILILTFLILLFTGIISANLYQAKGQGSHSTSDSTPTAAYIIITKNSQGKDIFNPQITTIKHNEEIMIINNSTKFQSFTNGKGIGDPMDGKLFSVNIKPQGFVDYRSNLAPGNYSFYSTYDPNVKGELNILP